MWIAAAGVEVWLAVDIKEQKREGKLTHITNHQYNRRPAAAVFLEISLFYLTLQKVFSGILLYQFILLQRQPILSKIQGSIMIKMWLCLAKVFLL